MEDVLFFAGELNDSCTFVFQLDLVHANGAVSVVVTALIDAIFPLLHLLVNLVNDKDERNDAEQRYEIHDSVGKHERVHPKVDALVVESYQ